MSASASGANAKPNGDAKNRSHNDGSSSRAFTVEQKAAVIRVRRCSPTAFYDILGLETVKTTCTDNEIKKAYRKLSLLTHPDKNGYDGADEAFKMVSRAFQILGDKDKKTQFDRFGGDPDSRFGAGGGGGPSASPFSGFARSPGGGRGPMFEEEISPEELFRQFFGGGGGMGGPFGGPFGGMFDTGPGFVFNLGGGPGIRVHQFGGGRPRRRPPGGNEPAQPPPSAMSTLQSLLPLVLLFILPIISSLFGGSSSGSYGPQMRFDAARSPHTHARTSYNLGISYWVNPNDVAEYTTRKWKELDHKAEVRYMGELNTGCENEQMMQQRMMQDAQGFFWTDEEKMREARSMELKNCRRLGELQRQRSRQRS